MLILRPPLKLTVDMTPISHRRRRPPFHIIRCPVHRDSTGPAVALLTAARRCPHALFRPSHHPIPSTSGKPTPPAAEAPSPADPDPHPSVLSHFLLHLSIDHFHLTVTPTSYGLSKTLFWSVRHRYVQHVPNPPCSLHSPGGHRDRPNIPRHRCPSQHHAPPDGAVRFLCLGGDTPPFRLVATRLSFHHPGSPPLAALSHPSRAFSGRPRNWAWSQHQLTLPAGRLDMLKTNSGKSPVERLAHPLRDRTSRHQATSSGPLLAPTSLTIASTPSSNRNPTRKPARS